MKIWSKTQEFSEGKFLVVRRDGTMPAWPHFVLGARDPAAPAALRAYADEAERGMRHQGSSERFSEDYIASIRELADDFERYRHAAGLGDPAAPPHRKDSPSVISAMRGEHAVIAVRPSTNKRKS